MRCQSKMRAPWEIYDRLIEDIDPSVKVINAIEGSHYSEITSSENSIGRGMPFEVESLPRAMTLPEMKGKPLRDVAVLVKSWNFIEASFGVAAINAWWGQKERVSANGFKPMESLVFRELFDPYRNLVAGKKVGVIGHFPFARQAMPEAEEICILERKVQTGDYPDSACEYLLAQCDYVFITGSAFVNKTMPRLLELCQNPYTIVVGPSAACAPLLLEYGADTILGFSSEPALNPKAAKMGNGSMYGTRVILQRAD
ncbi:hypothetical protein HHJ78_05805 [Mobiluncus mulieris]|uniref:Heavy-metal chelation domain-containing protein n=2 Tax=Mobiluncus mulieris TaxID=2052 RepID=A0A7Y0U248_9ACTO|nr:hypothetical protein [Mobiluncus mulieris]